MPSHLPSRSCVAVGRAPKAAPCAAPALHHFPSVWALATWLRLAEVDVRVSRTNRHCHEWATEQRVVSCGCRGSALVRPFPGHTCSPLGIYRDPPLLLTRAWRTSDAQTTNCVLCVSSLKANSTPSRRPQPPATLVSSSPIFELRQHTSSPSCCSCPRPRPSNTAAVTAVPLLLLVLLSRARSCVEHGRKGLWFHRRCRGKWSCQKGLLRRHLY